MVREIELLAEAEATVLSERRDRGAYGLQGGEPGTPGLNMIVNDKGNHPLPGKFNVKLAPGDRLRIETPGGGGWGKE